MQVEPCFLAASWEGLRETGYHCHNIQTPEHELDRAPLLGRAWEIQEVALAFRVLQYTKSQVF